MKIVKQDGISLACQYLKDGKVIAFPTETVYGIGVDGCSKKAYFRIYEIKKREKEKRIPFLIGDISYLPIIAKDIGERAYKLAEKFWPGPLTIILYSKDEFKWVGEKIGVRIPNHPITLSLLNEFKGPIATTSANISGERDATTIEDILPISGIELIIDGGKTQIGIPSTIVDVTLTPPKILREGAIYEEVLKWI
ncbi:TPA: threonylcarbamoyl-AMP synthase [bacterium]|nr:threonylcarbamoyl-AMP synthase [bacterium]